MDARNYRSSLYGYRCDKKSLVKSSISDREILREKIVRNPRYEGLQPSLDTGNNIRKKQEREQEWTKYYKVF